MRRLPPLAAVRVFEAAARHQNFTAAAAELGMTQAAVSYQIKLLEERLGAALFRREKKRVTLTEAGQRAAPQLTRAFDAIDSAFATIRTEDSGLLTVSTSNTFANTWFAWRLGGFQMEHPDLAVRLQTTDTLTNFVADDADCAVRNGQGPWPGLARDLLLPIDFTPMCSPAFLAAQGGALVPRDLFDLPRVNPDDPWWTVWLQAVGIEVPDRAPRPGIRLDSQAHEGYAAMAGQGIAMLTPFFWRNDLTEGKLIRPFAQSATLGAGYWLVYPEHRRVVPKIRAFREWLLAEVARDRASLVPIAASQRGA